LTPGAAFVHTRPEFLAFFACLARVAGGEAARRPVVKARHMLEQFPLARPWGCCAAALLLAACGGGGGFLGIGGGPPEPPKLCLELAADKQLNTFDGQPHVVVVHFYPLSNVTAFDATDLRDLVRGEKPAGLSGEPWQTTILPGQKLVLGEQLPEKSTQLGIVADYYRGPSRVIVPASCDSDEASVITLSPTEVTLPKGDEEDS
jgi:type VI secretion system VasD/TssJ family lipoprotein